MRFRKGREAQATQELLELLAKYPGLSTTEMSGTRKFHGVKTLRNPQIIRLLRKSGKAVMQVVGTGNFQKGIWTLKAQ